MDIVQFYPKPCIKTRDEGGICNAAFAGDKINLCLYGGKTYVLCKIVRIGRKKITIKTKKGKTKKIPNEDVEGFILRKWTKKSRKIIDAIDGEDYDDDDDFDEGY